MEVFRDIQSIQNLGGHERFGRWIGGFSGRGRWQESGFVGNEAKPCTLLAPLDSGFAQRRALPHPEPHDDHDMAPARVNNSRKKRYPI